MNEITLKQYNFSMKEITKDDINYVEKIYLNFNIHIIHIYLRMNRQKVNKKMNRDIM